MSSWRDVGTAVGYYYGGAWGALAGGAIGGAIDGPAATGKLEDLKAAKVSLGATIPHVFGHPRMGGNIAWVSEAIESGTVGEQGKGSSGGGQATYIRNILLVTGEEDSGPIVRIWFGGKLVYSVAADADDETVEASVEDGLIQEVINYDGADDQQPDPTYEEAVGEGNAPAHRGHGSAMLKGVACGTAGALPNITYEVGGKGTQVDLSTKLILTEFARSDVLHQPPTGAFTGGGTVRVCSVRNGKVVTSTATGGVVSGVTNDIVSGSLINEPGSGGGDKALMVFGRAGNLAGFTVSGSGYSYNTDLPDPGHYLGASTIRFSTWGSRIAIGTSAAIGDGADDPDGATGNLGNVYLYQHGAASPELVIPIGESHLWLALFDDMLYVQTATGVYPADINALSVGGPITLLGDKIFAGQDGKLYSADAGGVIRQWDGSNWIEYATLDLGSVDFSPSNCTYMVSTGGNVYAVEMYTKVVDEPYRFWWATDVSPGIPENRFPSLESCIYQSPDPKDALWVRANQYYSSGGLRARRNPIMGVPEIEPFVSPPYTRQAHVHQTIELLWKQAEIPPAPSDQWILDERNLAFYEWEVSEPHDQYWHNVYRLRRTPVYELSEPTLQEVVENLCYRAGLSEDQVDAEDLATKNVHALALTQVGATASTLDMLMSVYKFYCTETGSKLAFRFYGAAPVRTLAFNEVGATSGDTPAEALPLFIGNELELPSMQSVRYSNIEDSYQDGLESSDRLLQTTPLSATVNEYAIGLTPTEAKRLATTNQQVSLAGLIRIGPVSVGPENRDIEAGDSIVFTRQDGTTIQGFCSKLTIDPNGMVTIEATSEDSAAYDSDALTSGNYTDAVTVRRPPQTEFELLDIPMTPDDDDGAHLHVVAKPASLPWPGYSLQKGVNADNMTEVYQDSHTGIFGTCATALADWTGANVVDNHSRVTVDVGSGTLSSITRAELLSSRLNLCMVGAEMLQYQTAELITTGVYILSGMVRYLGGTEAESHVDLERFVLLKPETISRVDQNLADQGISRYWKAVTKGRNANTVDAQSLAPEFVSMKPLAPGNFHVLCRANGDVVGRANRRTRLQTNALRGIVPMDYLSESYVVEIYSGSTLVRTLPPVSTTSWTYELADRTADSGLGVPLTYKMRQIGAIRGHEAIVTKEFA